MTNFRTEGRGRCGLSWWGYREAVFPNRGQNLSPTNTYVAAQVLHTAESKTHRSN